jgi:hypothetical protein
MEMFAHEKSHLRCQGFGQGKKQHERLEYHDHFLGDLELRNKKEN